MKAEELMKYDWVECCPIGLKYFNGKEYVESIRGYGRIDNLSSYNEIHAYVDINGLLHPCCSEELPCYEFNPIPLTPEILEKNGFVLEYDGLSWYDGIHNTSQVYVNIAFRKNGTARRINILNHRKSFCVDGCETYTIHELQHALHLCGLEDLRMNFKV